MIVERDNYIFCDSQCRPQIHYIYQEEELEIMTVQKLDELENEMNISLNAIANSINPIMSYLWSLLPAAVRNSQYGIIDYIALETDPHTSKGSGCQIDIDTAAKALYRLGYRVHKSSPKPKDKEGLCSMNFLHPANLERKICYEDVGYHNFCNLWLALKKWCVRGSK